MSRLSEMLNGFGAELVVPEPQRTRVLLEVAQDLEDAYVAFRQAGNAPAEAAARAAALLGLDGASARELAQLHRPPGTAWLLRATARQGAAERVVLAMVVTVTVLGSGAALGASVRHAEVATWLLLGVAAAVASSAAAVLASLFRGAPDVRRLCEHVERLPVLGGASAVMGVLAAAMLLSRIATVQDEPFATVAAAAEVATLGLSITLIAMLLWLLMARRVAELRLLRRALERVIQHEEES